MYKYLLCFILMISTGAHAQTPIPRVGYNIPVQYP